MKLEQILFTQGFGTRRQCRALIAAGAVSIAGARCDDADAEIAADGLVFAVDGVCWPYREHAYVALHKPAGYECSREARHHPSVFALLPAPLATRGAQCVGRLDADTTGLLLLSDDGRFIHACASPKRKVPKRYRATTRHPVDDAQLQKLRDGVLLHGDAQPSAALAVERLTSHVLTLTLDEGKYHQVKRMIAAAGNRVEALHRDAIGGFALPDDLPEGAWMWLDAAGLSAVAGAA